MPWGKGEDRVSSLAERQGPTTSNPAFAEAGALG